MDRVELADFLRTRRDRLRPSDVGLAEGVRRRTPGLRRDEVAALAGMSVDYYARLEQRRGPHPSEQLLTSLARALRLDRDERDHLFYLAGQQPPATRAAVTEVVSPGMLRLLQRFAEDPAFVIDDLGQCLIQNPMSLLLHGDHANQTGRDANFIWRWFTGPDARHRFPADDHVRHSASHVADLRATAARRSGDADVEELVSALYGRSEEFRRLWDAHEVRVRRQDEKIMLHPEVGRLDLLCERLTNDDGQRLVLLFPRPGTDTVDKLALLRIIGTQSFAEQP